MNIKVESKCGYWFMSDGPWIVDLSTKKGQKRLLQALRQHSETCGEVVRISFAPAQKVSPQGREKDE